MANARKYLDQLFISKVRIKAIHYFFSHPDEAIHLRGAVRELDEEINAVRRELTRMEEIKMVTVENKGNRRYFKLNPEFVFFSELLGIVHKSFGLGGEILANAKKLGEIEFAFLTQRFTHKRQFGSNQIDLVVIGDVDLKLLDSIVSHEENRSKSQIHYSVLSVADLELRRKRKDAFVGQLLMQKRLMLIGDEVQFIGKGI
ncbi:MAG: hypothetical protein JNK26_04245 [Candidatus Doudnabacteria bacterium]|nr:hypothetical protein [Candidatus Doudnabacteria bacterium]